MNQIPVFSIDDLKSGEPSAARQNIPVSSREPAAFVRSNIRHTAPWKIRAESVATQETRRMTSLERFPCATNRLCTCATVAAVPCQVCSSVKDRRHTFGGWKRSSRCGCRPVRRHAGPTPCKDSISWLLARFRLIFLRGLRFCAFGPAFFSGFSFLHGQNDLTTLSPRAEKISALPRHLRMRIGDKCRIGMQTARSPAGLELFHMIPEPTDQSWKAITFLIGAADHAQRIEPGLVRY